MSVFCVYLNEIDMAVSAWRLSLLQLAVLCGVAAAEGEWYSREVARDLERSERSVTYFT